MIWSNWFISLKHSYLSQCHLILIVNYIFSISLGALQYMMSALLPYVTPYNALSITIRGRYIFQVLSYLLFLNFRIYSTPRRGSLVHYHTSFSWNVSRINWYSSFNINTLRWARLCWFWLKSLFICLLVISCKYEHLITSMRCIKPLITLRWANSSKFHIFI